MRQHYIFLIFCLIVTLGILQAFGVFKEYFSDSKDLRRQVAQLTEAEEREKLKVAILSEQMRDFKFEVAKALPVSHPTFEQKNLLSQVRVPASEAALDLSSMELENGRKYFREARYKESIEVFKKLIQNFPNSGKAVEARFLLAESFYLSGKYPECMDIIEEMMLQFPENELTGFIMLRMGQILQSRNRVEEADEVYRTVKRRFVDHKVLQAQVQKLIRTPSSL